MRDILVQLNTVKDIRDFSDIVSKYDFNVVLTSSKYHVDAKSIMGIFSLDISKPLKAEIFSDNCDDLVREVGSYIVLT